MTDDTRLVREERYRRFAEEIFKDPSNQAAAYRRAGYKVKSDNTAWANASRLLKNDKVQTYLKELQQKATKRTNITIDRVLNEYARIAFGDITDVIEFNNGEVILKDSKALDEDVTRAIASVTVTITETEDKTTVKKSVRMHDKIKALEALSKYLGLLDGDRSQDTAQSSGVVWKRLVNSAVNKDEFESTEPD